MSAKSSTDVDGDSGREGSIDAAKRVPEISHLQPTVRSWYVRHKMGTCKY
jgi:hypothetical protein